MRKVTHQTIPVTKSAFKKPKDNLAMRPINFILCGLIFTVGCCSMRPQNDNHIATFPWDTGGSHKLTVVVAQKKYSDREPPMRVLKVSDRGREKFTFETADTFLGAIPFADENGDLLSMWMGGSAYHFLVIGVRDGEVANLLEAGSKIPPELVFSPRAHERRPVIMATDGLMNEASDTWITRLFYWDGKVYRSKDPISFPKRLIELQNRNGQ